MLGAHSEMGDALHGGGTGTFNASTLISETLEVTVGVPTGIAVIPTARMESVALKAVDTGNIRQFWAL